MQIFKVTGKIIFKKASGLIRNWNILPLLEKHSGIFTKQMQNKQMNIHKTSDFESSLESGPSHIWSNSPKYCYTKLYQAAVF